MPSRPIGETIEASPQCWTNLKLSNADNRFHSVLLTRCEVYGKITDVACFDHPPDLTWPGSSAPTDSKLLSQANCFSRRECATQRAIRQFDCMLSVHLCAVRL